MDYEAASTRDKERINLLVTSNSTGNRECKIALDMCCEHKVRSVKTLCRSFCNQLEPTLITKAVMAQNSTEMVKDHWLECLGKESSKGGGEHKHDFFENEEKEEIRRQLKEMKMFQGESGGKDTKYKVEIRRVWENLSVDNIDSFLERNRKNYKIKKTYRLKQLNFQIK